MFCHDCKPEDAPHCCVTKGYGTPAFAGDRRANIEQFDDGRGGGDLTAFLKSRINAAASLNMEEVFKWYRVRPEYDVLKRATDKLLLDRYEVSRFFCKSQYYKKDMYNMYFELCIFLTSGKVIEASTLVQSNTFYFLKIDVFDLSSTDQIELKSLNDLKKSYIQSWTDQYT